MSLSRPQLWVVMVLGVAWQAPGCWCDPIEPEIFNTFPAPLGASSKEYCQALAPAQCAFLQRCDPARYAGYQRLGSCEVAAQMACEQELAPVLAAEQAGRVLYDARHARGCVEGTSARQCDEPEPGSCGLVFTGQVVEDAPCVSDGECARALFCSGGPDSCGLCTPLGAEGAACWGAQACQTGLGCTNGRCAKILAAGSACATQPTACPAGTACLPPFVPFAVCQPLGGERAPCNSLQPCDPQLSCLPTDGGTRCLGPVPLGARCDPQGSTAPRCQGEGTTATCNLLDRTCTAVQVVGTGASCGGTRVCAAVDRCVNAQCVARPRAGDSCSPGTQEPCFGATCTGGRCVAPARNGDTCDGGCPGLRCVEGRCGARPCDGGFAWDAWVPPSDGGAVP